MEWRNFCSKLRDHNRHHLNRDRSRRPYKLQIWRHSYGQISRQDNTYAFESGEACIGKEEDHPSTDLCVITGNSIGNLVDTPVKLAAVNIGKGEKLEMYSNLGSGWIKDVEELKWC